MSREGRIQLFFHLDDPEERAVYEWLCANSYRRKAQAVCELYRKAQLDEERLAERVATRVLAGLSQTVMQTQQSIQPQQSKQSQQTVTGVKRERGRPRKIKPDDANQPVTLQTYGIQQSYQSMPQQPDPIPAIQRVATYQPSTGPVNPDNDLLPDDDMLASMTAFVG